MNAARLTVLLLILLVAAPAAAQVRVVTTTSDLAWATEQVGVEFVSVRSLAAPNEDPHYVSPTPSLMALVGDADLFVEIGLNLEIWTERLLDGAGNPNVRPGGAGYVLASAGITTKERPATLSRSQGDLHPDGNPHVWLDPLNMKIILGNVAEGLARVDPANAETYRANAAAVQSRIDVAMYGEELLAMLGAPLLDRLAASKQLDGYLDKEIGGATLRSRAGGWLADADALRGRKIVCYHRNWVYFADRFGLDIAEYIEAKPGIPPSAAHRGRVIELIKAEGIASVVVTNYYDDRIPKAIGEASGARVAVVPMMTGGVPEAADWFGLIDLLIARTVGP